MAALSVSIPATEKAMGREGRGLLTPARGISLAPLLQKGTCVLEFGQGGGFIQPPWRKCVRVCVCVGVYLGKGVFV